MERDCTDRVCSPALVEQFEAKGITEKVASKGEPVLWTFDEADMYPKITSKIMYKEELIAYISVFVVNRESVSQAFAVLKELTPVFSAILSNRPVYFRSLSANQKFYLPAVRRESGKY